MALNARKWRELSALLKRQGTTRAMVSARWVRGSGLHGSDHTFNRGHTGEIMDYDEGAVYFFPDGCRFGAKVTPQLLWAYCIPDINHFRS